MKIEVKRNDSGNVKEIILKDTDGRVLCHITGNIEGAIIRTSNFYGKE